ncbi:GNAT family N-acetyltransferase [Chitinophaga barathri]|uniref:GNAT family N-acetyltransferase n=1 Tax=Chitinophaga barathri TaxID=1647451 RepID=A0A3N4MVJ6_9BACT|nr:GNAT family N-acetyltransferase [Chitinophaga barathri]RPD39413.1 GNAT family N-acetyltransferase [Chitinophaga barathri]
MQITKATTDHLPQLAVLFDLYRQHYEQQTDIEGAEQYLAERLVQNESVIYVAEEEGEMIGFTQLYPVFSSIGMKKAWILNDLYVSEDHRRKGVASGLLDASQELGKATDARYLMLQTHIDNAKARALYESKGWKLDEEFYYYYLSI